MSKKLRYIKKTKINGCQNYIKFLKNPYTKMDGIQIRSIEKWAQDYKWVIHKKLGKEV